MKTFNFSTLIIVFTIVFSLSAHQARAQSSVVGSYQFLEPLIYLYDPIAVSQIVSESDDNWEKGYIPQLL